MRDELGSTNKDAPFIEGDWIEMFDERYLVLKNYGNRGRVRLINTQMIIDPFYWSFQGMEARRVKRNVT